METINLQFFLEPPELTVKGILTIEALAPLSMVAAQPGKYYRSQPYPTENMLYGLLENALGWHLFDDIRKQVVDNLKKQLKKQYKKNAQQLESKWITGKAEVSAVGYSSLLQYHVQFSVPTDLPNLVTFDDLWSQQLRNTGRSFFQGSKHFDASLSKLINRGIKGEIEFGEGPQFSEYLEDEFEDLVEGSKVKYTAVRSRFPQYFVSPTIREYVIPNKPYLFEVLTTPTVSAMLKEACDNPAAPLYLGSNDGWVEVNYEEQ